MIIFSNPSELPDFTTLESSSLLLEEVEALAGLTGVFLSLEDVEPSHPTQVQGA